ncbi:MAG TPA: YbaB/EbfC family nucleoid-associated protein [Acidimicrobiales bacterium]|nr:YbaB/EbfC family nucleoid-associated protein [Acidimicrobiales bacterium]
MSDQFDMSNLLQQAQAMQQQLLDAQARAAGLVVEGQSGGGKVSVRMTGAMEVQAVSIAPDVVDPGEVDMLEDLVRAAVHDAIAKVHEATQAATREALGGLDLGDLGLPS